MEPSFNIGVKSAKSKKKRRGGALKNNIGNRKFAAAKVSSGYSWNSETGDTTESDSVNMEEECLVEETSFDYEDNRALTGGDLEQTLKSSKILTKRALEKLLRKINFLSNNSDNILLDVLLTFFPFLKTLVDVSIIRVIFTYELGLIKATKKTTDAKILVNTDLKKSTGHSDQAVVLKEIPVETSAEAVHAALSEYDVVVLIKMQLVSLWQKAIVKFGEIEQANLVAAHWSILIGKDAVHVVGADKDEES
ncbi:hypothetical protein G9A89_020629 [Geosiphon pyriformis]|nr:hypothetical protein G9A89_020629 [Geosiphon pyriformis]